MRILFCRKLRLATALAAVLVPHGLGRACVMPTPPKPVEKEIEIEDFGPDSVDGKHQYRVSIDVNLFGHGDTLTCQCGALLGASPTTGGLPASIQITGADLKVYGLNGSTGEYEYEYEVPELESEPFEMDDDLENELEGMDGAIEAETGSAFSVDLDPFTTTVLGPGQTYRLTLDIKVAEEDIPSIVNVPIQFAAGSTSPLHPVQFFQGYHDTLTLATLWPSDLDHDGDTDGDDLGKWSTGFGLNASGDIDGDGVTDGGDFLAWQRQLGNSPVAGPLPSGAAAVGAVPEPAGLVLALGLLAASWGLRRK
ncbi:MAG: hypothetical protein KDA44_09125 [Planctomycetales bacterium]|nr:hypothetical protein [Planctomycetales bacterium]